MPIDKTKITKEMLEKAAKCKTADELIALAKTEGFELTKNEAVAYLEELQNVELDEKALDKVAGGGCYPDCPKDYCFEN
ncbi:MAG: Nif11 family protein [Spirochaetia bacterium]|nr:Nif11 family protein [Spirochaetia bacterium]MBR4684039.1 Nif11 family protein [Spirochaetia bacterium]